MLILLAIILHLSMVYLLYGSLYCLIYAHMKMCFIVLLIGYNMVNIFYYSFLKFAHIKIFFCFFHTFIDHHTLRNLMPVYFYKCFIFFYHKSHLFYDLVVKADFIYFNVYL